MVSPVSPYWSSSLPWPGIGTVPALGGWRIAQAAKMFWNHSSEDGPDSGNLACAYMVNKVLKSALGKTYGRDPDTVNSVRDDLLAQGGRRIVYPELPQPGDLALSFNDKALRGIGGGTAHIGIFIDPWTILANSSKNRRFNQRVSPQQFAKLYTYFEVIRPPEALQLNPQSGWWV